LLLLLLHLLALFSAARKFCIACSVPAALQCTADAVKQKLKASVSVGYAQLQEQ
jgi:hypothetical protein